jgi:hypothetical protein
MRKLNMSTCAVLVAAGIALGASGGALANTYNLDIDHCTGGCSNGTLPFGTVQVTQNGANLDFLVTLNSTYVFQKSTGFDAFAFGFDNVAGAITNVSAGFSAGPSPTDQDGFGTFQLGISAAATGGQSLSFTVLSETIAHLAFSTNPPGDTSVLFAADISSLVGTQTITGNVGGSTLVPGVPEPATWGMMLLGFVGLGFAFRQSRRKVSFG